MIFKSKLLTFILLVPALAAADHGSLRRTNELHEENEENKEKGAKLLPPASEDAYTAVDPKAFVPMDIKFANDIDETEEDEDEAGHTRNLASYNTLELEQAQFVQYERVSRGLQPVYWSADLLDEAQRWAAYMASVQSISHRSPLSQNIDSGWKYLSENVAYHWSVEYSGAHTSLMNSAGHRANILHAGTNRIGVGVRQKNGYYYVCQIFKQV